MRNNHVYLSFLLVISRSFIVKSANILFLSNIPSPSHGIWNNKIMESLAIKGHNITILTPDAPKKIINNMHVISVAEMYSQMEEKTMTFGGFVDNPSIEAVHMYTQITIQWCQFLTESKGFKILLDYPENFRFDLIIYDFSSGGCLLGFAHKFNYPPVIGVTPFKFYSDIVDIIGGHNFQAYIPRPTGIFTTSMTLYQRIENFIGIIYEFYCRRYIAHPNLHKLIAPYFTNLPNLLEIENKIALILLNTHSATDFPVPLPPNVIEVGGLQISDPKPLTEDLREFIESSKAGAILISFGTNVHKDLFAEDKQNIVVDFVKKFPNYNFLWKFEEDITNGKVNNLMVKPWLPQNDILAHPKMKAFITHSGGLSTHEATYHGVPMVAVPFFGDQHSNARHSVAAGVALQVSINKLSVKILEYTLRQILDDPSFSERMKRRSSRFTDRPMKPLDTAIWWIEYIIRDPNPQHLRSPVLDLGHIRANSFDIVVYIVLIVFILIYIIIRLTLKFMRVLISKRKTVKFKKN